MKIEVQPLRPLDPTLHPAYTAVLFPAGAGRDPLPPEERQAVTALLERRNVCEEADVAVIDAQIVARLWWYALRPDEIARRVIEYHGLPRPGRPITISQATLILAALGEAGYPITGNGAPDYDRDWGDPEWVPPVRGEERHRVIWAAAEYWARLASQPLTYVSLGDCRGFLPRPVQYDQPGSMNPMQRAALTFGPWADRGNSCDSHGYMRRHTRLLLLVRD